ncbi:MAG TPA: TfoX/Sxy family protein [Solirubrobacteraceae bacterium]|nr:TfoX/Sxy family protein [Solirubrobacteraceae bacterium]
MAYDEALADRVRDVIGVRSALTEKKMFGGVAWMIGGNMACGVIGDELIVRLDREEADAALGEPHVRAFDFTGRPMRGFVVVGPEAIAEPGDLTRWVDCGADYAASLPAKG